VEEEEEEEEESLGEFDATRYAAEEERPELAQRLEQLPVKADDAVRSRW